MECKSSFIVPRSANRKRTTVGDTLPVSRFHTMFERWKSWFGFGRLSDEQFERERQKLITHVPVPVFWLFGKTGSGKTSIVRFLTGATTAEIGNGYRPQTKLSSQYDFPTPEQPIVRFLDTRGLGEVQYDPAEDLRSFAAATQLMIVTARVADQALEPMLVPLRQMRAAHPSRPVVLALTCLHEAYPQQQHPQPDPFSLSSKEWPDALPGELRRLLVAQQERFAGLVDRIVPLDLTPPEEGFDVPNFGGERLEAALIELLPEAYRQTIWQLDEVRENLQDLSERQALPLIVSYSSLATAAAAAPLPWVDIPVVMGLQTRMVYLIAELYGQKLQAELLMKMVGAIGGRLLLRFAIRAPLKFIPLLGQTANAAMAFAYTFSLGKACCWYFGEVRAGHVPTSAELDRVWGEKLKDAVQVWKRRAEPPAEKT
jgi:uncharacterized protein (DUF697 family)